MPPLAPGSSATDVAATTSTADSTGAKRTAIAAGAAVIETSREGQNISPRNCVKCGAVDTEAPNSGGNVYSDPENTNEPGASSGKPHFAPLCTKCAKDHKKQSGSSVPGFIINSKSFTEAANYDNVEFWVPPDDVAGATATANRRASASALGGPRLVLRRSSIVKQEVLIDGTSISNFYDINVGNLGKGSYGSVVKAQDLRSGNIRAVKIIYKPRIENIVRLKREILIMTRLDHPNIIRLFEVYEDAKNLYLVMELCTGGELFDRIIKSGHFSERYAATLMKQVFGAISYCHCHDIMHRDLKPENLLFADPSPVSALKVIDWGFAAKCGRNHKFSSVVGTPYYVAPEVLFGNYDKQCDLWSAGVILFILLCGYPPFHGKDNKDILRKVKIGEFQFDPRHWKRVSDHAKDLVRRLLAYDPKRRLTATEAMQHPWIQYYTQVSVTSESPLSTKLGTDLVAKFKNFQRFNKMKRLAITCVAYQLTEKDIGTLHDIFTALDKNGDGVLTVQEISSELQKMDIKYTQDVQGILEELDTDGNGTIDYTEFIAASLDHKLYEQESICRTAFRVFDLDGDGKITIDELHKVIDMNFMQQAFTREMIEEIVQEVDLNNDGSIDFDEFMKMMRGTQRKKMENKEHSNSTASSGKPLSKARFLFYRKYEGQ